MYVFGDLGTCLALHNIDWETPNSGHIRFDRNSYVPHTDAHTRDASPYNVSLMFVFALCRVVAAARSHLARERVRLQYA